MKNRIAMFCLVACLAWTVPGLAATQTFGPDFARFTVDVPDGWTAKPNDGGCQITAPDGGTSVSIQVQKSGGKSASELAGLISKQMGGKVVKTEDEGPNQTTVYAEIDGVRVALMIIVDGDKFAAFTMAGSDAEAMKKIAASVADAQ